MARVMVPRDSGAPGRVVPFLSTFVFVLVSVVPLQLPGFAAVTPSFALMAVAHWTIYRPDLLPQSAVFALGLLLDLLNGTPYVGTMALTLLVARTAVLTQRRHFVNRDFTVMWLGFLALASGTFALLWAIVSLLNGHILGTRPFLFEAALTVACYPVGSYLLARLHRAFLRG
ncbi:MAG TPA: rod shape-determining protein MreD [Stellaceae bacterium]|nr:rod shape-determining protein MreD [Stellaceae bacterium]